MMIIEILLCTITISIFLVIKRLNEMIETFKNYKIVIKSVKETDEDFYDNITKLLDDNNGLIKEDSFCIKRIGDNDE